MSTTPTKVKLFISGSEDKPGNGILFRFMGTYSPAEVVISLPAESHALGIEGRKKAVEFFGENGFEFVDGLTGETTAPYTVMDVDYAAGDLLARQHGRCERSGHGHHDVVYGEKVCRKCGVDRVALPLRCTWHPCCLAPGHAGEHQRSTRTGLVVLPTVVTSEGIQ